MSASDQDRNAELRAKLARHGDDELDELRRMSREELDDELAAAGIDFPSFYADMQRKITQSAEPDAITEVIEDGIAKVKRGARQFLCLTLDAMEDLHRACSPVTLRSGLLDDPLLQKLQQQGEVVVLESLNPMPGGIRLTLRWLTDAPETAPQVEILPRGNPVTTESSWLDWRSEPRLSQGLEIRGSEVNEVVFMQ